MPNVGRVCSNRSMRKWQRDRMRRRKAKPEGPSQPAQPQPEPLQPAYPDMDRPLQMSKREPEAAPEPPPEPAPESIPAEAGAVPASSAWRPASPQPRRPGTASHRRASQAAAACTCTAGSAGTRAQ